MLAPADPLTHPPGLRMAFPPRLLPASLRLSPSPMLTCAPLSWAVRPHRLAGAGGTDHARLSTATGTGPQDQLGGSRSPHREILPPRTCSSEKLS